MFEEVVWGSDFARTGWRKVNAEGVSPVGFARREDADKDVMSDRARWFNGQELTAVHDLRFLKRTVVTATYYEDVP
ncbi:hypothetical protein HOU03_gp231 [Caulobacter phage CcrSC]|uniref:Uncharacterized protein n=1 Tax=Caulobacter phage CcrSC TaxID=2283272 RepID=A0A385EGJ7_9CAUD|nr:hypothetical protein HOU03_gp231 [Caulobacter phage CcrSC]AXQ70037.1 hypothetical protein CcrSC_gp455 [Caulobacter phage CcrSC]